MNILAVDDCPNILEQLCEKIAMLPLDIEVHPHLTAEEACENLGAEGTPFFDFVILDEHMPPHSGTGSLHVLKRFEKAKDAKAILLTGMIDDITRARALAAGFDAFIEKPIREEKLSKIVVQNRVFWDAEDLPSQLDLFWEARNSNISKDECLRQNWKHTRGDLNNMCVEEVEERAYQLARSGQTQSALSLFIAATDMLKSGTSRAA